MRFDLRPAAGDILQEAFVCVVGSDVVGPARQRAMLVELAALKASRGCPPAACGRCGLRADCEARVVNIIGAAETGEAAPAPAAFAAHRHRPADARSSGSHDPG